MLPAQHHGHQRVGDHRDQHGGERRAAGEGLEQHFLVQILARADEERADDGAENAHGGHQHRHGHGAEAAAEGGHTQRGGGDDGADVGLVQVGAHAGHIAHVVAHVIGNGGGVAGIILRDAGFDLADQVGADVGRLGEDTATHTGEQRHRGRAHTEGQHGGGDLTGGEPEDEAQQEKPDRNIEKAQTHHGKAHDRAGGKRHAQTLVQPVLTGAGRAAVGGGGDLHADKAAQA